MTAPTARPTAQRRHGQPTNYHSAADNQPRRRSARPATATRPTAITSVTATHHRPGPQPQARITATPTGLATAHGARRMGHGYGPREQDTRHAVQRVDYAHI